MNIEFKEMVDDQLNLSTLNEKIDQSKKDIEVLDKICEQEGFKIKRDNTYTHDQIIIFGAVNKDEKIDKSLYYFNKYILTEKFNYIFNNPLTIYKGEPLYEVIIRNLKKTFCNQLNSELASKQKIMNKYRKDE